MASMPTASANASPVHHDDALILRSPYKTPARVRTTKETQGQGLQRHARVPPDRKVAWFDEALETPNLGPCRGSGVLIATDAGWKIAQYNLSIPIPNDLVDEFKKRIEGHDKEKPAKKGP